jgi:hypothetical protein
MKEIVRPRRLGQQDVLRLASHLTERDRWIARDCFEFRVLTTNQIRRLYFTGTRTAAARLNVLYRLRVLDRFRPSLPMGQGTAPYHWILDEAGALIVADHLNIERAKLGWQHSIAASIAHSQKLPHHIEVNEFFTRLAVEANVAAITVGVVRRANLPPHLLRPPRRRRLRRPRSPGPRAYALPGRAGPRHRANRTATREGQGIRIHPA